MTWIVPPNSNPEGTAKSPTTKDMCVFSFWFPIILSCYAGDVLCKDLCIGAED